MRDAATSFIKSGLINYGYRHINIDDAWEGEPRDAHGEIQTNAKFGDMKALADYVHANGLKLGIYSSPGPKPAPATTAATSTSSRMPTPMPNGASTT